MQNFVMGIVVFTVCALLGGGLFFGLSLWYAQRDKSDQQAAALLIIVFTPLTAIASGWFGWVAWLSNG